MEQPEAAKLLRVHIGRSDQFHGKPLYEAIVDRCRELHIEGATVLAGHEGYGETGRIQRHHLTDPDEPLVVIVVDTASNIARLAPVLEEMIHTGVMAMSDVEIRRIERPSNPSASLPG